MGFGLYQGDKLGGEALAIYQRLLQSGFLAAHRPAPGGAAAPEHR
jgi:type VI protein secretion system component VasK